MYATISAAKADLRVIPRVNFDLSSNCLTLINNKKFKYILYLRIKLQFVDVPIPVSVQCVCGDLQQSIMIVRFGKSSV